MRILYLSCHSILEYDEVRLLSELGHEVFPAGAYVDPANPHDDMRPPIPGLTVDSDLLEEYGRLAPEGVDSRDCLTKSFVDKFDAVIVMHLPKWISDNWSALRDSRVIWRTIGQSLSQTESQMLPYRNDMEVIRYSPKESTIPGYIGEDAIIRFYKDPADYGPWTGEKERVITFAQNMKARGPACNFNTFELVTRPFERHLFGPGNENTGDWCTGKVPYSRLQEEMKTNRVYLYTGTHPASYTLNFMEAWMTGIPVIALGKGLGNASYFPGHDLYEVADLIEDGETGFVTSNPQQIRQVIEFLFENHDSAQVISDAARAKAIEVFGKDKIKEQWRQYLNG